MHDIVLDVTNSLGETKPNSFPIDDEVFLHIEELKRKVEYAERARDNAKVFAKQEFEQDAVEKLFDYSEGCDSGKADYCDYMGWEVPSREYSVSVTFTVPINEDYDDVHSDIEHALRNRSDVTGYYIGSPEVC